MVLKIYKLIMILMFFVISCDCFDKKNDIIKSNENIQNRAEYQIIPKEENTQEIPEEEENTQEILARNKENTHEILEEEENTQEILARNKENTHEISEEEENTQEIISKKEEKIHEILARNKENTHEISEEEENTQEILETENKTSLNNSILSMETELDKNIDDLIYYLKKINQIDDYNKKHLNTVKNFSKLVIDFLRITSIEADDLTMLTNSIYKFISLDNEKPNTEIEFWNLIMNFMQWHKQFISYISYISNSRFPNKKKIFKKIIFLLRKNLFKFKVIYDGFTKKYINDNISKLTLDINQMITQIKCYLIERLNDSSNPKIRRTTYEYKLKVENLIPTLTDKYDKLCGIFELFQPQVENKNLNSIENLQNSYFSIQMLYYELKEIVSFTINPFTEKVSNETSEHVILITSLKNCLQTIEYSILVLYNFIKINENIRIYSKQN